MTSPKKNLSTKRYQASDITLVSGGVIETVKKHSFVETLQSVKVREGSVKGNVKVKTADTYVFKNTAVREGPRRFREGKREARNIAFKSPQSVKVREGSVKGSVKGNLVVCVCVTSFWSIWPQRPFSQLYVSRKREGNGKET